MALPVYSARFGVWKAQTGAVNVLNESGNIWIIRQVTVWNGNELEVVNFGLGDYNSSAVLVEQTWQPPGGYFSWEGRLVILPSQEGDSEGFYWTTNGFNVDVYVGGYTLSP